MDNILGYYLMPHIPEIIYEVAGSNTHRLRKISQACDEIGKEISKIEPETIVILSSHGSLKEDAFTISMGESVHGDFKEFKNVDMSLEAKLDNVFSQGIIDYFNSNSINYVINSNNYKLNHGVKVPLYFVDKYFKNYKLVTISSSSKDNEKLFEVGKSIRKVCKTLGKSIVVIASYDAKINRELPESHRKLHKKEIAKNMVESNDIFQIFKKYNNESEIFKEFQKNGKHYISFINGLLGRKEIIEMFLSYEELFNTEYAVVKLKTK